MEENREMTLAFNAFTQSDKQLRSKLLRFAAQLDDIQIAKIIDAALRRRHRHEHTPYAKFGKVFIIYGEIVKGLKELRNILRANLRLPGTTKVIRVLEENREVVIQRVLKKRKKAAMKRNKLEKLLPEILELRIRRMSFDSIKEYLAERYGLKISRETLRKFILENMPKEKQIPKSDY